VPGNSESKNIARGRGKWSRADVPHRGWRCLDIEDNEYQQDICEMCETQEIRFIHVMVHPDYDKELRVGCVCAGHMEENLVGARDRETRFKLQLQRKTRWLSRKWRVSRKGSAWLNYKGFRVIVYAKTGGWGATIADRGNEYLRHAKLTYKTDAEAKLASFRALEAMLGNTALLEKYRVPTEREREKEAQA